MEFYQASSSYYKVPENPRDKGAYQWITGTDDSVSSTNKGGKKMQGGGRQIKSDLRDVSQWQVMDQT